MSNDSPFSKNALPSPSQQLPPRRKLGTIVMSSPTKPTADSAFESARKSGVGLPMPGLSGVANDPVGNLLKGPVDDNGKLKDAGVLISIKLDIEAEVHLTA
ncbi:hypothetical protein G7Y89_g9891 [Cudoniella acicularis]|uniref:Uncharacterized protein n=1 Tax=Cudoniella acicularis TaxID=354080 RepID=A0A8H4VZL0_9HELO|nr:hypothetical protein G7Y89_g9891 [Cudoniella acicularis]